MTNSTSTKHNNYDKIDQKEVIVVQPPTSRTQKILRGIVSVTFFFIIAAVTYFGMRPNLTRASESENAYATLNIPVISLNTPVEKVDLSGRELIAPETIAGVYHAADNKEFLFGHSTTVFKDLKNILIGALISYLDEEYVVGNITIQTKDNISMDKLLEPADVPTLVLMTCYGESLGDDDYSHRLIVTAEKAEQ